MILFVECVVFCALMFIMCYLGTGTDDRNIKSFRNYPDELQQKLMQDENINKKIVLKNKYVVFLSNTIMFFILIFIFGIFIRTESYLTNFVNLLILGEVLNLFDFAILDFIWFRNSKRVRFSKFPQKSLYKNMKNHAISFLKAIPIFALVAACNAGILILF